MKSIEQVINENPELYEGGWQVDERIPVTRGDMLSPDFREQVDRSLSFIRECCVQVEKSNRAQGSYGLKRLVEHHGQLYVSNGAFIVAALMLGYEARRFKGSPNCAFNLKVVGGCA